MSSTSTTSVKISSGTHGVTRGTGFGLAVVERLGDLGVDAGQVLRDAARSST